MLNMSTNIFSLMRISKGSAVILFFCTVRRWTEVTCVKSAELKVVLLEGREKEGAPVQTILPLPVHRSLSHRRWSAQPEKNTHRVIWRFIGTNCTHSLSSLVVKTPQTSTVSDVQHPSGAGPRLPNAAVCCSLWLHTGVPENDQWPGDAWSSAGAFWGHGAPAAPEEAAAAAELKCWSDDAPHRCWWTFDEPTAAAAVFVLCIGQWKVLWLQPDCSSGAAAVAATAVAPSDIHLTNQHILTFETNTD